MIQDSDRLSWYMYCPEAVFLDCVATNTLTIQYYVDVLVNRLQKVFSCYIHLDLQEYKKRLYELLKNLVKSLDTSSGIT